VRLFRQAHHLKDHIAQLIETGLEALVENGLLPAETFPAITIERTRDSSHGDFACNIAMVLARRAGMSPRDLAAHLVDHIPTGEVIERIDIAGPGFINFFLKATAQHAIVGRIIDEGERFGHSDTGQGVKILIEFVSANPTGPLHVGHGRGAAYGATVANLLQAIGYSVEREYYVNDAGRQMDILACSVYIRYLQQCGVDFALPEQCYQGDYINDIAAELYRLHKDGLRIGIDPPVNNGDAEAALDALIGQLKSQLGARYQDVHTLGLQTILSEIRNDLEEFGVEYDRWYSEQSLQGNNQVGRAIEQLDANGYIYEKDGARWFRSSDLGDEKDRVVVRENGQVTYFASDIAYHDDKFRRGYGNIINIWGADHHGYIARVRAALEALGHDSKKLDILLVQFVSLFRGKEKLQMSTRSGQFVTLEQLRTEVGRDATRFFYVMRKSEQHLDFDMELAKSSTKDNPVYYIQYAHARVASLLEKVMAADGDFEIKPCLECIDALRSPVEVQLLGKLSEYPEVLHNAAVNYEPHLLVYYLRELATEFHAWYDTHRVMGETPATMKARMVLCLAVQQIIRNGLTLLGVSAPGKM
jgi:arginyl-tRNA synthetase